MKILRDHYKHNSPRDTNADLKRYGRYAELCEVRWITAADYSTFLMIEDFVFAELEMRGITMEFPHERPSVVYTVEDHLAIKRKEIEIERKVKKKEKELGVGTSSSHPTSISSVLDTPASFTQEALDSAYESLKASSIDENGNKIPIGHLKSKKKNERKNK